MGFYDTYEEDGKETDLKGYLYTFCYAKKPYEIMEGTTDMILYNKRNTYSFINHAVTAHRFIFHTLFIKWMGYQRLWIVVMPHPLREIYRYLYHVVKFLIISPLELVQWRNIL